MVVARDPHPVEVLVEHLPTVEPYPSGVAPVSQSKRIAGSSFFPGGNGLWAPSGGMPDLPPRPVMVLGNNWGIVSDHESAFAEGAERMSHPTWRNLLSILRLAELPTQDCFFTNAFMGLMDSDSNIDDFPGARDHEFCRRCRDYLRLQLRTVEPRLVIAMGSAAVWMLSELTPDLRGWRGPKGGRRSFKDIAASGSEVVSPVRVEGVAAPFVSVAMKHTSDARNLSQGFVHEAAVLRSGLAASLAT
jgi:hypothetical protein